MCKVDVLLYLYELQVYELKLKENNSSQKLLIILHIV